MDKDMILQEKEAEVRSQTEQNIKMSKHMSDICHAKNNSNSPLKFTCVLISIRKWQHFVASN